MPDTIVATPPTGEPPTGSLPTGSLPTGEPPTGSLPTGEPPTGEPPTGTATPPTGEPPTGTATPPTGQWLTTAPDDWREAIAGDDSARLNQLMRVSTPEQLMENYFAAQDKIRTGQIEAAAPPDEHSTDEQWSDYREAQGIPATADAYALNLSEGLVVGDEDQQILDEVYPVAHKMNLSTEAVNGLVNAMMNAQAQQYNAAELQQNEYQKEADALVRTTWKGDYETNKNMIESTLLGALPENVRNEFAHAMMPDGRKVFNSPEILIAMAEWARQINPSATVVPNNANPMAAINDEIATLEAQMGSDDWHKDASKQERYMQLITARSNLAAQG